MYELQGVKGLRMFESLPDSVASALGVMKPEPPTRTVIELHKQGKVVESGLHTKTLLFSLVKTKDAVLRQSHFGFVIVVIIASPFHVRRVWYR